MTREHYQVMFFIGVGIMVGGFIAMMMTGRETAPLAVLSIAGGGMIVAGFKGATR
jgi:hypothetical protein